MLASRSAIEGGDVVARPCSHVGIRCKHRQSQRPRIVEYPLSALNQFGARTVASEEKGCGESDPIVRKFIPISYSNSAIAPSSLSHTLSVD